MPSTDERKYRIHVYDAKFIGELQKVAKEIYRDFKRAGEVEGGDTLINLAFNALESLVARMFTHQSN